MHRKASVYMHNVLAGHVWEHDSGYAFKYEAAYLNNNETTAISNTLPLKKETFESKILFPFFDGLIPEGWLLEIAEQNWKLNEKDRMGLLLACCKDCIGAVSITQTNNEEL